MSSTHARFLALGLVLGAALTLLPGAAQAQFAQPPDPPPTRTWPPSPYVAVQPPSPDPRPAPIAAPGPGYAAYAGYAPAQPARPISITVPLIITYNEQDAYGLAVSAFGNLGRGGGMYGLSIGGVANSYDRGGGGLHLASLFNRSGGSFKGAQLALINAASGRAAGVQLAAVNYVSYAAGEFVGLQLAPANIAGEVRGLQLGVVNVARQVRGLQLGLINTCRRLHGAQIGLVNLHLGNRIMPAMILLNIGLNS